MRYHYQQGATQPKKRFGRAKFGVIAVLLVAGASYAGLLVAAPTMGSGLFSRGDETAKRVRTVKPGADGDRLYIPKLNSTVAIAPGGAELKGELGGGGTATVHAARQELGLTPQEAIARSPFSRLAELKDGDEFFIDYKGIRYAYAVAKDSSSLQLMSTDNAVKVAAKAIGIVAWNGGEPRIETLN